MRAYNLDQVAERLGLKRRYLADWLRAHRDQEGKPYYSRQAGKTKLFTDADVVRIFDALPQAGGTPCSISRHRKANTVRTAYAAPSSTSESTSALAYATELLHKRNSNTLRRRSPANVIPLPRGRPLRPPLKVT